MDANDGTSACCDAVSKPVSDDDLRAGLRLEWFTIAYNVLEGVAAIGFGLLAGSIALVGFGFDSAIEVAAAGIVAWRLRLQLRHDDPEAHEAAEMRALRFVGVTFLVLATYVLYESVGSLIAKEPPAESVPGIVIAALSLIVMPVLAWMKRRAAKRIGSGALRADSVETAVCAWLSFALLLGLATHAAFGWWWADPVAALVMVPLMLKEGTGALRGESCCG